MVVFIPFERVASDDRPSMTLTARGLTFPYRDAAIFALPNERVSLEVRGAAPRLRMVDERASGQVVTLAPNRSTWHAPAAPGEQRPAMPHVSCRRDLARWSRAQVPAPVAGVGGTAASAASVSLTMRVPTSR